MNNPKVSVVTVCYNAASCLEETMLSVINQSYDNIEYIIIDGNSKDGSLDIIKKYAEKITYWVSEPDKGIFNAMNKGLQVATGDWINFMNAGDSFMSQSTISDIFNKKDLSSWDVLFGDTMSKQGMLKLKPFFDAPLRNILPVPMGIVHQSIFVKTPQAQSVGFNEDFKVSADYNMMMTIYKNGGSFRYIDMPVAFFDTNGFSFNNMKKQLIEESIICEKTSIFHHLINDIKYLYRKIMYSSK